MDYCEICEADGICLVAEVRIPVPNAAPGEPDEVMPHVLCAGADCRSRVEAYADREGGQIVDVYLFAPVWAVA